MELRWLLTSYLYALFISSALAAESRVRIAIIDTGMPSKARLASHPKLAESLCKDGHKDFSGEGLQDAHGHGTNIAGIVSQRINPKTHCLTIIKWYHIGLEKDHKILTDRCIESLAYSIGIGSKFINMSLDGGEYVEKEKLLFRLALSRGIKISVAAGNSGLNLDMECYSYPACYRFADANFHVVGNLTEKLTGNHTSNFGRTVKYWEIGTKVYGAGLALSGTSQATAVHTGKWASGTLGK